jgi:hypothetical protein
MQRSQKGTKETKAIVIRELTVEHKDRIRQLLRHGDVGKIAIRVSHVGYQQVINVLSPNHPTNNDRVWQAAIEYLNSLPAVELDVRLERYIKTGVAA